MSAPRKKILLFDAMDTLVRDPFFEVFPKFFDCEMRALLREKDPDAWPRFECGDLTEEEYFRVCFRDRRDVDGEALKRMLFAAYELLPGIETLLRELQARDTQMHILSNYPIWYRALDERVGLSRFLPWTFVSCRTGVRKPDAQSYLGPAQTLGHPPEDLIFVDDRSVNVDAARACGLDAIAFTDADALRYALVERRVLE